MAIPVINPTQSIPGYLQGQYFEFQPWASNMNWPNPVAVSGITLAGAVATVTTGAAHGFANGASIRIIGADQAPYNGDFIISAVTTYTFQYTVTGTPATPATSVSGIAAFLGAPSWSSAPLPAGMSLDPWSGLISGAALIPGVYNFALTATNSTGASAAQTFTFGITAADGSYNESAVGLSCDLDTGLVTSPATLAGAKPSVEGMPSPIAYAKLNDLRLFNVRFLRNSLPVDLDLTDLKLTLKEFDTDAVLCISSAWKQVQTISDVFYEVYLDLTAPALAAALSDYQADTGTLFSALAELSWLEVNPTSGPTLGAAALRYRSRTFAIEIDEDLTPTA